MISDFADDLKNNILEKSKSPFAGAFIISWCARNWSLLYTLYYFDPKTPLDNRITIIHNYLHMAWPYRLLILPTIYALVATISYLLLKNLTLAIFVTSDKWVKPAVYYIIDRNRIVSREDYENTKTSLRKMKTERDEASEGLTSIVGEKKDLEKKNAKLLDDSLKYKSDAEAKRETEKTLKTVTSDFGDLKLEYTRLEESTRLNFSKNLRDVFNGKWKATSTDDLGNVSEEEFVIRDNFYLVKGNPKYILSDVKVNKQNSIVFFRKESTEGINVIYVHLLIENDNSLIGFEIGKGLTHLLITKIKDQ